MMEIFLRYHLSKFDRCKIDDLNTKIEFYYYFSVIRFVFRFLGKRMNSIDDQRD